MTESTPERHYKELAPLTVAVALSRYAFRSKYLYDVDSVNFALGIAHFNPATYQPHPPGYFLYIWIAGILNKILGDPNTALVTLSILASCGTLWAIHKLTAEWFGAGTATWAALIFLFSPLAWFHGTVALTYIVEAFFSALLGLLFWRIRQGGAVIPASILFGLAAGIRPSGLLFLSPLFLYALSSRPLRARIWAIAALLATLLLWVVPMIESSGGWTVYTSSLWSLWKMAGAKNTVLNSSIFNSLVRAVTIGYIYLLCFGSLGAASILALLARISRRSGLAIANGKSRFIAVWLLPGLLFFTFVFLRFVNSGYLLILFPPVCACLGRQVSRWYAASTASRPLKISLTLAAAALNVAIFLAAPVYCSYRGVRGFEKELSQIRAELPTLASPSDTLIVGFDSHNLGYRHAGYYLDRYVTVQYPEVALPGGARAFAMAHRDTWLATDLEAGHFRRFVFFPLPKDPQFTGYLTGVRGRLPAADRQIAHIGSHDYESWPIRDLPILFPATASSRACISGVSSALPVYKR